MTAEKLLAEHPLATKAECLRFWNASKHSYTRASKQLEMYLQWRKDHDIDGLSITGNGHADWNLAVETAFRSLAVKNEQQRQHAQDEIPRQTKQRWFRAEGTGNGPSNSTSSSAPVPKGHPRVPQLVFCPAIESAGERRSMVDATGNPILHCLPAQIDLHQHNAETIILILAVYLHTKLADRSSLTKYTLLVDVRPGQNWPNPPAMTMIGFLRQVSSTLQDLIPDRLGRCIVFNVPRPAVLVFDAILKPLLRFQSARSCSLQLLAGGANVDSDVTSHLISHLEGGQDAVDMLEGTRNRCMTTSRP